MDIRRTMGSESKHISLRAISGSNAVAKSIAGATNTNGVDFGVNTDGSNFLNEQKPMER